MDQWLIRFRNALPAKGYEKVIVPGDPEREMETMREKEGIPLLHAVVENLDYLAEHFRIPSIT
jgi:LDH2 family malate/lactate/ureidoglycolate dehydrogenase